MIALKCKMCGGNIIVAEDKVTGTCDSCGSRMTLPKIGEDRLANLFNRANRYRMVGEYDKALSTYENILSEDNTIAEAHWGAVLCRYGVEYVDDPASHEKVPTCNLARIEPVTSDADYLEAIKYAELPAKKLYESEAAKIARIQKGILDISSKAEPFDIFISYKDRTETGARTKDSVYAQEIYNRLTDQGYKVFFSRITLEDKIGQQYEPHIFAALNSAKVMLVVGTSGGNFTAPWVKNEWGRYINIIKERPGRLLIPCYRDMDVYDLPDELSVFQSQDMGKIGFEQDLLHGINKIFSGEGGANAVDTGKATSKTASVAPTVESLLKRADIFLSDGEFEEASAYFNRVLDIDPVCGVAYAGLLCVEVGARSVSSLGEAFIKTRDAWLGAELDERGVPKRPRRPLQILGNLGNYKKAIRYGDQQLAENLRKQEKYVEKYVEEYFHKQEVCNKLSELRARRDKNKKQRGKRNVVAVVGTIVLMGVAFERTDFPWMIMLVILMIVIVCVFDSAEKKKRLAILDKEISQLNSELDQLC